MSKLTIGANLKRILRERGVTQGVLAKELGVSRSNVSDIVNGHVDTAVGTIKAIAEILKVDIAEITGGSVAEVHLSDAAIEIALAYDAMKPLDQAVIQRYVLALAGDVKPPSSQ
jgi:transcriptional regulator with XRE-family HTH domain